MPHTLPLARSFLMKCLPNENFNKAMNEDLINFFSPLTTEKAMAVLPSTVRDLDEERELSQSPVDPLPIYQQRDNFFS